MTQIVATDPETGQVISISPMTAENERLRRLIGILGDAVIESWQILIAYETIDGEDNGTCIYCDCIGGHEPGCQRQRVLATIERARRARGQEE